MHNNTVPLSLMEIFQIYISFNIVQRGGIYLEKSQIV